MWKQNILQSSDRSIRFRIKENEAPVSILEWLKKMKDNEEFRSWYNGLLADTEFEAFFWENPPFTESGLDQTYECTIIDSPFLAGKQPAPGAFREYFKEENEVVTFPNLGKDALLIVPCPKDEHSKYTHIGEFVRGAKTSQIDRLWQMTAAETLSAITSKPRWLSTSGLGVFWLHIRIDRYPKYYQTPEYKQV